jgi:hypothetical protein
MSAFDSKRTSTRWAGFHTECKLVAIGIEDIKVAHAIIVVLWWLDYFCSARGKFRVKGIQILHKDIYSAVAGEPLRFLSRKQVQSYFITAQTGIKNWVTVLKRDSEPKCSAVMLDTLGHIAHVNTVAAPVIIGRPLLFDQNLAHN